MTFETYYEGDNNQHSARKKI